VREVEEGEREGGREYLHVYALGRVVVLELLSEKKDKGVFVWVDARREGGKKEGRMDG